MVEIKHVDLEREYWQKGNDLKVSLIQEASDEEVQIEVLIRERYSMSQELALHRKKAMGIKTNDFKAEWDEYVTYVTECVEAVRNRKEEETEVK